MQYDYKTDTLYVEINKSLKVTFHLAEDIDTGDYILADDACTINDDMMEISKDVFVKMGDSYTSLYDLYLKAEEATEEMNREGRYEASMQDELSCPKATGRI